MSLHQTPKFHPGDSLVEGAPQNVLRNEYLLLVQCPGAWRLWRDILLLIPWALVWSQVGVSWT